MLQNKSSIHVSQKASGFTLVELLIVAPIVILVIAAFIGTVLTLTGSVLATKTAGTLAFNIQDALNRIEQDTRQSGAFLATNNITLTTPQGYDNGTSNFNNSDSTAEATNADGMRDSSLILNAYATTANPISVSNITPIPAANEPNACASASVAQNTLVYVNIVYFVKNNTLWRRVITPSNYSTVPCSTPWQQGSCASSLVSTYPAVCKTNDIDLVDNIVAGGFAVNYLPTSSSTLPDTVAVSPYPTTTAATRQAALHNDTTVTVSITASQVASGHTVTQSGTILGISNNNDTTSTVAVAAPTTPVTTQPSATSVAAGSTATFTANDAPSGVTIQWQQSIDGGVTWLNVNGATSTTLSITPPSVYWNLYQYRAVFTNAAGTAISNAVAMTVTNNGWTPFTLQNGWNDYNQGYNTDGFRMTSAGVVIFKGMIQKSGTPVSGEVIGLLPLGYRPSEQLIFGTSTSSNTEGRVDVVPSGNVLFQIGSQAWFSLEDITYIPSTSAYNFISITPFTGSWAYFGSPYAVPAYTVDSLQRVHLKGLVKAGSGNVAALPAAAKSSNDLYLETNSNNAFSDFVTVASGNVITPVTYNNSFLSLQAMYYSSSFTGWTALAPTGAWSNYGGTYPPLEYTKAADGLVTVQGFIKGGAAGSTVATLPAGYRPALTLLSAQTAYNTYSRVDVLNTGAIVVQTIANNAWASLNNLTFYADQ